MHRQGVTRGSVREGAQRLTRSRAPLTLRWPQLQSRRWTANEGDGDEGSTGTTTSQNAPRGERANRAGRRRRAARLAGMARAGASRGTRRSPKSGIVRSPGRRVRALRDGRRSWPARKVRRTGWMRAIPGQSSVRSERYAPSPHCPLAPLIRRKLFDDVAVRIDADPLIALFACPRDAVPFPCSLFPCLRSRTFAGRPRSP